MKLTIINEQYKELKVRDMGELELRGAQWLLLQCIREDEWEIFGEYITSAEKLDEETYYCSKLLNIAYNYLLKGYYISAVFTVEGNSADLFGIASKYNDMENNFIVRFDY